jgi:hypothetical protein
MVDEATPDELTRRADEFERAWTERAAAAERLRARRARRTQRQFWFLFVFLFASFILLAWRTETNTYEIRVGFWQECTDRQVRIVKSNEGREALIAAVVGNPERPVPADKVDAVVQQLRDGLLLPTEDCGPNPGE